jgi:hypothetical protein
MNRMLVAATFTAIVTLAAPAFAADQPPENRDASTGIVEASGGAPMPAFARQGVVPVKGEAVSGTVLISTPGELVVHTAKGLQRFTITPKTEMTVGAAEGEDVTVVFRPARGFVSGRAAGSASLTTTRHAKVAELALAVMPRVAGVADR